MDTDWLASRIRDSSPSEVRWERSLELSEGTLSHSRSADSSRTASRATSRGDCSTPWNRQSCSIDCTILTRLSQSLTRRARLAASVRSCSELFHEGRREDCIRRNVNQWLTLVKPVSWDSPHPHPLRIQRKLLHHRPDLALHSHHRRLIPLHQHLVDQLRHPLHLLNPEAPRRHRRRAEANAAGDKRRLRIA